MKLPFTEDDLFDVFPVPIETIAMCYYGIEIHRRLLPESVGGILHKFGGRSYLYLNTTYSIERQRFTIAHEITHQKLHPVGVYMAGPGSSTASERAADMIAADMLMPKWKVRQLLHEHASFSEMRERFGVSKEAMRVRLDEMRKEEEKRARDSGLLQVYSTRITDCGRGTKHSVAEVNGSLLPPGGRR